MNGFLVALRKEWMEQWRTYRLLVVVAIFIVFGLLSPVVAKFTPQLIQALSSGEEASALSGLFPTPTILDAVAQYVKNIAQFGVILGLLLTMGAVAQEKERGTAGMMLVKPLPRISFLSAKFAAIGLTFAVAIVFAGVGCYYYTQLLFGPLNLPAWFALNGFLLLYVLVYVSLTLLCSVLLRSPVAAGGLAFGLMLVMEILATLPRIGQYFPAQLLGWGMGLVTGVAETHWPALVVGACVLLLGFIAAWRIFEHQEF